MYQVAPNWRLTLGSASPRRKRMLEQVGIIFDVRPIAFDERLTHGRSPSAEAQRLALLKNLAYGPLAPGQALLTADTLVGIDGQILTKPASTTQALEMISLLAGRSHQVATGFCLQGLPMRADSPWLESGYQLTQVTFRALSQAEIKAYVACNESMDKAGAYGIQKKGSALVESINGSFHNVVGLPLAKVIEKLLVYNVIIPNQGH